MSPCSCDIITEKSITSPGTTGETIQSLITIINQLPATFFLDSCKQTEGESEHKISDETSEENSLDKVLYSETHEETETERLVRLGEMTPFGTTITKHGDFDGDDINETDNINTGIDASGDNNLMLDVGQSDLTKDLPPLASHSEEGAPVDSDEDYIPDDEELKLSFNDDEQFMPEDDLVEPMDDITIPSKKTKTKTKTKAKKSKRLYQSIKDDGDDRAYQIRIRYDPCIFNKSFVIHNT